MNVSSIKHLTYPKTYLLRAEISAVLLSTNRRTMKSSTNDGSQINV